MNVFKNDESLIILILHLFVFNLRKDIFIYFPMKIHFRIKSVSVLTANVSWIQNRIGFPSFSIPIVSILLESARLCIEFRCLNVLICFSFGGISIFLRTYVSGFGGAYPFRWLYKKMLTTHEG